MPFRILAVVASAVLTAGMCAVAAPAGAAALTHQDPATLHQLAQGTTPQCDPCGPYEIQLIHPPNGNFVTIHGNGHNNPVFMGPDQNSSLFYFYHAGTFHGVTTWVIVDQTTRLCLNAAVDGGTGLFEIYEDGCPANDPYEQFQLNARSAHYISNVGVSEYFNNGVQSGDLSADESDNYVDVLDNPGNYFWSQWQLV